jgi:hypothetical protein
MDPEMEEMPTDYAAGLDFRIAKTQKGGYADYSTSKWARKESALTAEEAEAIEKHGLYDLASFLPKKPGEVELKVMKEMFEASVDGQPFDMERWGQYYRPAGMTAPGASDSDDDTAGSVVKSDPKPTPPKAVKEEEDDPADAAASVATAPVQANKSGSKAEDILAMIRARQQK